MIAGALLAVGAALWVLVSDDEAPAAPGPATEEPEASSVRRTVERTRTQRPSRPRVVPPPFARPRPSAPESASGGRDEAARIDPTAFDRTLRSVLDELEIEETFELRCDGGPCVAVFRPTRRDLVVRLRRFREKLQEKYEAAGLDVEVHTLEKMSPNGGRYVIVMPEVGGDPTDLRNLPDRLQEVLDMLEAEGPPPEPEEPMPKDANPFAPDRDPGEEEP
ncbi:MAG: hypothetical protein D6705_12685 [Deltaproteobacteria bacterium]|nr:MAG: hypothetical protein D6705_12685 [Deltaproteobacteria bacterium]